MVIVNRPTIETNIFAKAACFLKMFCALVMWIAQRLQFSVPEFYFIAMMRFDMIDDGCGFNVSFLQTKLAKRKLFQLQGCDFFPAMLLVPLMINCVWEDGRHSFAASSRVRGFSCILWFVKKGIRLMVTNQGKDSANWLKTVG